jgi:hypothetical protein
MKKLFVLFSLILIVFGCHDLTDTKAPPAIPPGMGTGPASDNKPMYEPSTKTTYLPGGLVMGGGVTTAIPDTGIITEAMSQGICLNDLDLTGNTTVQLLALSYQTTIQIYIGDGTYVISLAPPSGEKLMRYSTLQTANYEIDLSHAEGDCFVVRRIYSASEAAWVWQVLPGVGTIADGGAS